MQKTRTAPGCLFALAGSDSRIREREKVRTAIFVLCSRNRGPLGVVYDSLIGVGGRDPFPCMAPGRKDTIGRLPAILPICGNSDTVATVVYCHRHAVLDSKGRKDQPGTPHCGCQDQCPLYSSDPALWSPLFVQVMLHERERP